MQRIKTFLAWLLFFRVQLLFAPLLIVVARTGRGRFHGWGAVIAATFCSSITLTIILAWAELLPPMPPPPTIPLLIPVSFVLLLLCIPPMILLRRPPVQRSLPVGSHFLKEYNPNMFGWDDIEDEYMLLIVQLITRFAFWLPSVERRSAQQEMVTMVQEIQASPDYFKLPRITSTIGRTIFHGRLDPEHCYSFHPQPRSPDERFGMLLFIHGHGPNYLILLHALRPLAEQQRLVIVAPSFGYGNWEAPGGSEAIERARQFGYRCFPIDPDRVYLAGLSQGGEGVTRAANDFPEEYAGLIYISAVIQMPKDRPHLLANCCLGKPVLVIHGERDHHVRFNSIQPAIEEFESAKAIVTKCFHEDSDHFLFFAKRREILMQIAEWMR
jgi:hypothetical protein